jgi:16S rRNA (guanine966-N2)-methyltransferase
MDYKKALEYYKNEKIKFDLVFLDPPYKNLIINEILTYLVKNDLLNNKALIICEFMNKEEYISEQLLLFKERKYGEKKVFIYKYDN